jgi:uncharacterized Fe-S cluster protein YjdI
MIIGIEGICSHAGYCTDNLPSVFKQSTEPWIDRHGVQVQETTNTVRKSPARVLSYTNDNVGVREQGREAIMKLSKDGPYHITRGTELIDEPMDEEASEEHYAPCRCGGSKNKPFRDGTYWYIKFKDEKN